MAIAVNAQCNLLRLPHRNGCTVGMGTALGKPNLRISLIGLGTVWGTYLFSLSGCIRESSSSCSFYGPPLAGSVGGYNHHW